jgi:hypothetical protein
MKVNDLIQINKIKKADFDSEFDRNVELVSVYLDLDTDEVENMTVSELNKHLLDLNKILNKNYKPKDAVPNSVLTLGNFIDLERYLQNPDNFGKVCAILHRKKRQNEWGHWEYEPVNFDIDERAKHYEDADIDDVVGGVNEYLKFRESIHSTYKTIFSIDEPEPIETDGLSESEIRDLEKEIEKEKQVAQYTWEIFVYWLADNKLTDVEQVLNFPVIYALNLASMKKLINE